MSQFTPQEIVKKLIEAGYTQVHIEEHTGVNQSSISRLLTGKHTDPRLSTVRALEKFYLSVVLQEKA
ncbi:helix-turn-helix transcriptional regulator [Yersinia pseudotuberculosis]|uniref:helix-turn-helix transcriptional regulator n=1 Tax=Yersinia pseudotuberculosis TaxID=633 RepID=UPI0004F729A6|nr:helix-turn-helix transcriptional regulator [Yersinia pseudotuberculosis]AIN15339.1 helix-turn-helix family protein [Yersinia pseudotuberculosis]MBO1563531.1 helix-turn-helix domain-containing protein [Yersinia pseudotuberculosis]CND56257.1 Helix-turn-helix [Yersinia pseudotuberculosis]CQH39356.1 Helix-turn-helix [Yersinia pseudotuberculosis]SUQ17396.1 Helix-turn-helix [Yersinia pseudotuberculosis]